MYIAIAAAGFALATLVLGLVDVRLQKYQGFPYMKNYRTIMARIRHGRKKLQLLAEWAANGYPADVPAPDGQQDKAFLEAVERYIPVPVGPKAITTNIIIDTLLGRHTWVYRASAGLFDVDYMFHLSNSKYHAHVDAARAMLLAGTGLYLAGTVDKKYLVAANVTVSFRKEIGFRAPFEIHTKVVGYDERSITMEHAFVSPTRKDGTRVLHAIIACRLGITGRGTTRALFENLGLRVSPRRLGSLPPASPVQWSPTGGTDAPSVYEGRDPESESGEPFDPKTAPADTVPISRAVPIYIDRWHNTIGHMRANAKTEFGVE